MNFALVLCFILKSIIPRKLKNTNKNTDKIFLLVKFTAIYRQKYSVSIFVCIYQFSDNDTFQNQTQNQSKIQVKGLSKIKLKSNLDMFFHVVSK